jgi:hypothetical protein
MISANLLNPPSLSRISIGRGAHVVEAEVPIHHFDGGAIEPRWAKSRPQPLDDIITQRNLGAPEAFKRHSFLSASSTSSLSSACGLRFGGIVI